MTDGTSNTSTDPNHWEEIWQILCSRVPWLTVYSNLGVPVSRRHSFLPLPMDRKEKKDELQSWCSLQISEFPPNKDLKPLKYGLKFGN